MTTFDQSESSRARSRQNAVSANRGRTRNAYGAGYVRDTLMQCPKQHIDYVLRPSKMVASTLLIYDCPEPGCFITLQLSAKR